MKIKKLFIGFIAVSMLSVSTFSFAQNPEEIATSYESEEEYQEIIPISLVENTIPSFKSFTGKVLEISDFNIQDGTKLIKTKSEDGNEATLFLSPDTYIVDNVEIKTGDKVTGYYDANKPMIMIYPPQYTTEVICVKDEAKNIMVDIFNEELVSSDNFLKLNISEQTEIVLKNGTPYNGDIFGRKIVVTYGVTTKSIPAQTTPSKIVVLSEKNMFEEANEWPLEESTYTPDVSKMDIIVSGKKISAPTPYTNSTGTVMVPLRAIAEALDFSVKWESKNKSVQIGIGTSLTIGEDLYIYMKTAPIKLGTSPELIDGRTFVPLSFFREVMKLNNAYVFESQIVIDNEEKMY